MCSSDLGSGSGWTTALLASCVGENGNVEGVERIADLVEYGLSSLRTAHIENATIHLADPEVLGHPGRTYDRILVSASAQKLPVTLYEQLKPGGRLVIPIRDSIWCMSKDENGEVSGFELPGFRFVPLIVADEDENAFSR